MAIACLRLFTLPPLPPLPLFNVPFLRRCMTLFTSLPALREYLAMWFLRGVLSCNARCRRRMLRLAAPERYPGPGAEQQWLGEQHQEDLRHELSDARIVRSCRLCPGCGVGKRQLVAAVHGIEIEHPRRLGLVSYLAGAH